MAPAIGPFLGGYLADEISWRAIFYIILPVGAATILGGFLILSSSKKSAQVRKFDFIGFFSFAVFLAALLIAFSQGQREGWNSDYILSCFGFSLLGLVAFIGSALWLKDPIIDLGLFTNHNFMMTSIINFVRSMATMGSTFLIPLFLQHLMDYKALDTGIILLPTALSLAAVSPFSGLISDRIGPKIPIVSGVILLVFSLYCYKDISIHANYWFLFWPQMIRGIGIGLINAPLVSASFNAIPKEQTSMASGLYNVIHQLGGAFGIALLGTILQRREFFHYAHYVQQVRDVFSPSTSRALLTMQELLLRYGLEPTEVVARGKNLFAQYVHGLAKVAAFQDAFVSAAVFVSVGIVPSLLIRTAQLAARRKGETAH